MKKYLSNLFAKYPFVSTFGLFFSMILFLFLLSKPPSQEVIEQQRKRENTAYFERITGYKMNPEDGYTYESVRSIYGDGYSIWTYNLEDTDAQCFKKPDSLFFTHYPKVGKNRTHWHHHTWKQGPFADTYEQYLHLALDIAGPDNKSKVYVRTYWFDRIRSILAKEDCLYAFNFIEISPDSYPSNVDFYIISPSEKILIVINHNM